MSPVHPGHVHPCRGPGRLLVPALGAVLLGAVGMPVVLTAASFLHRAFKYLLPIPALATTAGAVCGFLLALRKATPLEAWGWLLVAAILIAGFIARRRAAFAEAMAQESSL